MSLPALVKRAAAWSLLRGGAVSFLRSHLSRGRAIVLMYHRVNDEADPFFPSLPVATFRAQLEYLTRHYRLVPLASVPEWLDAGCPGPPPVALTLDDGYPDTHRVVLPELERLGVPLTLFLSTSPPETGRPLWTDRVRHLFKNARAARLHLPSLGIDSRSVQCLEERLETLRLVLGRMKRLAPGGMERALEGLEQALDPEGAAPEVLGWDAIRRMARGPVALGAHTHNHYLLSRLEDEQVAEEIETSARLIDERTGRRPDCFAYPNGAPGDYDGRCLEVLKRLGFRCAVTTVNGFARPGHQPLELPRIYTTEGFLPLFAARLEGLSREVT